MSQQAANVFRVPSVIPKVRTTTHVRRRPGNNAQSKQARCFTTSRSTMATAGSAQMPKNIMKSMQPQQSMRSRMKSAKPQELPNDLGLLPQTLILPPNKQLPKLFSGQWKKRLQVEWLWTRTRVQNFFSLYYFNRWDVPKGLNKKSKKRPYDIVERTKVARDLHRQYYTALAEGDLALLNKIACKGLLLQSTRTITQRGTDPHPQDFRITAYRGIVYPQFLRWPLLSFLPFHAVQIMSDKVTPLPFGKNNMIRQMVARISSQQQLQKFGDAEPKRAKLTEYVVIQKRIMDGMDEGWKIWGTTTASTMKEIDAMLGGTSTTPRFADTLREQGAKLTGM